MPPVQASVRSRSRPTALFVGHLAWLASCALAVLACGRPNLSERSSGSLTIVVTAAPDPPVVGRNTLTVLVRDSDGAPVSDATVEVSAQMPMMGHGSSESAVVESVAAGTYRVYPLTFAMPGEWEVAVSAAAAGQTGTSVTRYDVR